jgi:hypothetical protein
VISFINKALLGSLCAGGRSWPAAPLKNLRVTKIKEVASLSGEEKDLLARLT